MKNDMNSDEFSGIAHFDQSLKSCDLFPLTSNGITNLQINLGKLCNQGCGHCHVNAGPGRREIMTEETIGKCLDIIDSVNIPVVDLTGGAPELNPNFRTLVSRLRESNRKIISRTNLTIMLEKGQEDLPDFFAQNGAELMASMPCYLEENVDRQRGEGVHAKSIRVLKNLNEIGYGIEGSGLVLNLVYNPGGSSLPPDQNQLEQDYKRELRERHGVEFNNLLTMTNMPIGRFETELRKTGGLGDYMKLLADSFNPDAAANLMCIYTLSVGWNGFLYDCDFNQMLDLRCDHGAPENINDFNFEKLSSRKIVTGMHCYGCTAGLGSGCHGITVEKKN